MSAAALATVAPGLRRATVFRYTAPRLSCSVAGSYVNGNHSMTFVGHAERAGMMPATR